MAVLTLLLGGFTAFGPLSMDLYLPAFPRLAEDLGATPAQVQLTLLATAVLARGEEPPSTEDVEVAGIPGGVRALPAEE